MPEENSKDSKAFTDENIKIPKPKGISMPLKSPLQNTLNAKFSQSEKEEYLKNAKKTPPLTLVLKYTVFFLIFVLFAWGSWLMMDLDSNNKYLSNYGIQKNIQMKYTDLSEKKEIIGFQIKRKENKILEVQEKIDNKKYTSYTELIQQIKADQLDFFDTPSASDSTKTNYGILEAPFHVKEYLTSSGFDDIILSPDNKISLKNVIINRKFLTFDMSGTNTLFGTTFYLHTKFLEVLNSFPFLQNGVIDTFRKEKDEDENYTMNTSLKFEIIRNRNALFSEKDSTEKEAETIDKKPKRITQQNTFLDFQKWRELKPKGENLIPIFSQE